jgi:hypothetical protein
VTDTTKTSAGFTGQVGHTYAFYSVATDRLGLAQPTPSSAQATTKVVLPPLVTLEHVKDITNTKHQVTEALLTFSGPVNSAEADQIGTYRLATPGKGGSYTAKNAAVIKLKSAVYTGANDTVALTPSKPFALTKPVELVVYASSPDGLKDSYRRYINGGTNATAILSGGAVTIEGIALAADGRAADATPAIIDALFERDDLAVLKPNTRARRDQVIEAIVAVPGITQTSGPTAKTHKWTQIIRKNVVVTHCRKRE